MPTKIKIPRNRTVLSDCKPCQLRREQAQQAANRKLAQISSRRATAATDDLAPGADRLHWEGPIVFEGILTGDGRYIQKNALNWGTLPLGLGYAEKDSGGHDGAEVVGHINTLERRGDGAVWATGDFDVSDVAQEAARRVRENLQSGISVDLDDMSFTLKVKAELLQQPEVDPDDPAQPEVDSDGMITVADIDSDAEVMDVDAARIRAATLVRIPAYEPARISLVEAAAEDEPTGLDGTMPDGSDCSCDPDDDAFDEECDCGVDEEEGDVGREVSASAALVASTFPASPPSSWFADPKLSGPTPLKVTADGRVYGHLAIWDTCHRGFQHECVTPPHSASSYVHFHTGAVLAADGSEIAVGHLTLDTLHADKKASAVDTLAHYEHTGCTAADVRAGEDAYGIWLAGATRPQLSDDQLRTFRASPLSGDWRAVGGSLELIAALAVNVPGFPVPRAQGVLAASGAVTSLQASGVLLRAGGLLGYSDIDRARPTGPHLRFLPRTEDEISAEALGWLRRMTEPQHKRALSSRAAQLARKVKRLDLVRRVHTTV